jgi:hypothetical protein
MFSLIDRTSLLAAQGRRQDAPTPQTGAFQPEAGASQQWQIKKKINWIYPELYLWYYTYV